MNSTEIPLEDFITFQRGFDLPKLNFIDGEFPVVGSTSILGYHNEFKAKGPGLVTGRSGTLGSFQYIKTDFWPHNTTLWVKDFKGNYPRFVYYYLLTLNFEKFNSGGAVPTLNRNLIKNYRVKQFPFKKQKKIASILSAYDDLIENNLKRIKLLEEAAQMIYKEWFVNFRFPGYKNTKFIDGLPEGWGKSTIMEVAPFSYGKSLPDSKRIKGIYPIFGSSGIIGYHSEYLIEAPGIVIGRKGNVGSIFWVSENFYPIDTVFYIQKKDVSPYLFYSLKEIRFLNSDAAVPGLNRNYAHSSGIILPNVNVLNQFNKVARTYLKQIALLKSLNSKLRQARDLLLPKLMTGEIEV